MLSEDIIEFLSSQNPNRRKELTELVARAQYYYLTHDEFTLDSTITFTLKGKKIEPSDSLDFLGIRIKIEPDTIMLSSDRGNPFGPISYTTLKTCNSIVTFPLSLFDRNTELKETKTHFIIKPKKRYPRR